MNAKVEQAGNSAADIAKLSLAVLILAAGVVGYYWFNDLPTWQRLLMLIAALVVGGAVGFFTRAGHALRDFLVESNFELRKVVWPTRQETLQTTVVVFIFVAVAGVFFWLLDLALAWATKALTGTGG